PAGEGEAVVGLIVGKRVEHGGHGGFDGVGGLVVGALGEDVRGARGGIVHHHDLGERFVEIVGGFFGGIGGFAKKADLGGDAVGVEVGELLALLVAAGLGGDRENRGDLRRQG